MTTKKDPRTVDTPDKKKVRDDARDKREKEHKDRKDAKAEQIEKARMEQRSKWFEEWTKTGRIHALLQKDLCDAGVHVWRPKVVNCEWDGETLVCVGQNCPVHIKMKDLTKKEQKVMLKAFVVYGKWFDRSTK